MENECLHVHVCVSSTNQANASMRLQSKPLRPSHLHISVLFHLHPYQVQCVSYCNNWWPVGQRCLSRPTLAEASNWGWRVGGNLCTACCRPHKESRSQKPDSISPHQRFWSRYRFLIRIQNLLTNAYLPFSFWNTAFSLGTLLKSTLLHSSSSDTTTSGLPTKQRKETDKLCYADDQR